MKKIYLLFLLGMVNFLKGQSKDYEKIIPKSPELAAIGKYIDKPISLGTGSVDYQIPLENLLIDNNISIPINLRYNTDGIKVNEEASNVGLGWTLSSTSFITINVKGESIDDYNLDMREKVTKVSNGLTAPMGSEEYHWLEQNVGHGLDTEPDEFIVNLFNTNFRFYYNFEAKKFESVPNSDYTIKSNLSSIGRVGNFEIIDNKGTHYFFHTINFLPSPSIYTNMISSSSPIDPHINSWYLSKIITKDNNVVEFKYIDNPNSSLYHTSQFVYVSYTDSFLYDINSPYAIIINDPIDGFKKIGSKYPISDDLVNNNKTDVINNTYTESNNKDLFLTTILVNGKTRIEFTKSNNERKDAFSSTLENIYVYDLEENLVKSFNFKQSYFNDEFPNPKQDCSKDKLSKFFNKYLDKNQFRLRLDGIIIKDKLDNKINDYQFSYYEGELPNRLSYSQDLYGYYNGKNNCSLIPYQNYNYYFTTHNYYTPTTIFIGDADRSTDINFGKIGALKKIIYPTKGSLELDYENHLIAVVNDYNEFEVQPTYEKNTISWGLEEQSLDEEGNLIPFPDNYESEFEIDENVFGTIYTFIDTSRPDDPYTSYSNMYTVALEKLDNNLNSLEKKYLTNGSLPVNLSIGKYKITAKRNPRSDDYDPFLGFHVYYDFYKKVDVIKDMESGIDQKTGGGLRIKKIVSKDHDGKTLLQKSFKYIDDDGLSSGILYGYPIKREDGYYKEIHKINGNISFPLQTSSGSKVVYRKVTEIAEDYNSNKKIQTDYYFKNETGEVGESNGFYRLSTPSFNWKLNQLVKQDEFLENSISKSTEKFRDVKNFKSKYNYGVRIKTKNTIMYPIHKTMLVNYDFEYEFYPLQTEFPFINREITTEYFDNSEPITTEVNYNYDSENHLQLTKQTTSNSKGETLTTEYQYPSDLTSGYPESTKMTRLVNENRIAEPVIVKQKVGSVYISEIHNQYKEFYGILQKSAVFQKKGDGIITAQNTDRKIVYNSYDVKGNITQYTPENGAPVAIIWGYNSQYPVAKLEGIIYDDAKNKLGSYLSKLENGTLTNDEQKALRLLIPEAMITTYVYKPLVGVTTITGPNGMSEFYKYDEAGRLQEIRNDKQEVLKTFQYNYKN